MPNVALVTGGTSGIGAATCEDLAHQGHSVIASYGSDTDQAEAFSARTKIPVRKWNVASFDDCLAETAAIERELGRIDILVNNAGITRDCSLHKMDPGTWQTVIDVNLNGCFNMCRAVINGMRERGYGRIINVASVNGQSGQFGQTNYAAAKAGMIGLTKSLALESASHGITVNAIAPGYTDTAMVARVPAPILTQILKTVPVGRLATAMEIAKAISFLASADAAFITGATLSINGGHYMV
jgi:acetoacetyl-CoA reductase